MKRILLSAILLAFAVCAYAQKVTTVDKFNYAGPYQVSSPLFDTKDAKGKAFDRKSLMDAAPLKAKQTKEVASGAVPEAEGESVGVFSFFINDLNFKKVDVEIKGT